MTDSDLSTPAQFAGIRNFGWAVPGLVARGEQPPLDPATFEALRELGIRAVLSLRPDREPPTPSSVQLWPEYIVERERDLVEAAGMRFFNVPLEDWSAPPPDSIADALTVLDTQVARQPGVYVHCRAGAGRAGVISGAWLIAHGGTGDRAAELYELFMNNIVTRRPMTAEELHAMRLRVGQQYVWWALGEIAHALGSPIHGSYDVLAPERPPAADTWPRSYWDVLQPWRERRD
jgi:protein tyrosine phosphatase (PTP) superfamily phosphohydrolase (DUF442 family)